MAATSTTETWDAAWTLTMRAKRKRLTDNISDSYPTVGAMRRSGLMETENGGKEIQVFLESSGATAESFDRGDVLSKTTADPFESAFYKRRYYAVPVVFWDTDGWENAGPARQFDFLTQLGNNAMKSLVKAINEDVYTAQAGKNMLGFPDLIADAAGATVGGVDSGTFTFWECQRYTTSKTFLTQTNTNVLDGFVAWNTLSDSIRKQGGKPMALFTTWSIVAAYRAGMSSQGYARTTVGNAAGIGGSYAPEWYGADVIPDNDCSSLHGYMVSSNALHLNIIRGANFRKTPFVRLDSNGQLGQIAYCVAGVQLTTPNRRANGVYTAVTGI